MKSGTEARGLTGWLLSPAGIWAAAFWGFAEGTLFFFIPDIILTATAMFSVKRSLQQMAAVLIGSLVAGLLMFGFAVHSPEVAKKTVMRVPFVKVRMFEKVKRDFDTSGVWALCKGPTSGVPYKVYAVTAPAYTAVWSFLLVSIPARLERLVPLWALFAIAGKVFRRKISSRPSIALAIHVLYWVGIYAFYWTAIGRG